MRTAKTLIRLGEKQIWWIFDDSLLDRDNFTYFSIKKHILWVLIRIASVTAEAILMSTHNIYFHEEL